MLLLLLGSRPAEGAPESAERLADLVLEALRTGDAAALERLARDTPDPWGVAFQLLGRGEQEAAESYAGAAAGTKDTRALPGYVRSRRGKPVAAQTREALRAAKRMRDAGDPIGAIGSLEGADAGDDELLRAQILGMQAVCCISARRPGDAEARLPGAIDAAEGAGWIFGSSRLLALAGTMAMERGAHGEAARWWRRRLLLEEGRGDAAAMTQTLVVAVQQSIEAGWIDGLRPDLERIAAAAGEDGPPDPRAAVLYGLARLDGLDGAVDSALARFARAQALGEKVADRSLAFLLFHDAGKLLLEAGNPRAALPHLASSLAIAEEGGDAPSRRTALRNLGIAHTDLGEYAEAMRRLAEALESAEKQGAADGATLLSLGNLSLRIGDRSGAERRYHEVIALSRREQDLALQAKALTNLGCLVRETDPAESTRLQEEALGLEKRIGNRSGIASSLINLASLASDRGDHEGAATLIREAMAVFQETRDLSGIGGAWDALGIEFLDLGKPEEAEDAFRRALAIAEECGDSECLLFALAGLAEARLKLVRPAEALESVRRAVEIAQRAALGLDPEKGAVAREQWSRLVRHGLAASVPLGDLDSAWFFLESGRGRSLLEALGGTSAVAAATIPETLRAADASARASEAAALRVLRAAEGRDAARAARAAWEEARDRRERVVERIRREAVAGAEVAYPAPATLAAAQACLRKGELLILYSLLGREALALVVGSDAARVALLGPSREIRAACEALSAAGEGGDGWEEAAARLRRVAWDPLALPESASRILVSPSGPLAYVPFPLVDGAREVELVPSGSLLRLLRARRNGRGEGVLAVGDPSSPERGGRESLPAARDEARSVGDVVLLGPDATEAGLASALGRRERWRAVHFACHAVVDTDRPLRSALALAATEGDDGLLTALEILRLRVPADLALLSACSTARGALLDAEGVVGLTPAFLHAGARQVLVSLWDVDDDATAFLMAEFHRLWNPDSGEPVAASAALRRAMQSVRGRPGWAHPRYWAAWQLWGPSD